MGCDCINIEFGSYDNQTILDYPEWFESKKTIRKAGIDNCLLNEIKYLWEEGIQTMESCCGHNKAEAYISVLNKYHDRMIGLGYKQYKSPFRNEEGYDNDGYRIDMFEAKSINNNYEKNK